MSEKKKDQKAAQEAAADTAEAVNEAAETVAEAPEAPEAPQAQEQAEPVLVEEDPAEARLAAQEEKYLRLCAEYDNYRKRTAKEKEASWSAAKAETAKAFLPVYDNLERALKQETADEAYRKGVELTMQQLKKVLSELGLEEIPALGQSFDANVHSAVMHVEDPELGENIVKEVYQTGFKLGDSVVRYAMVVVAN